MKNYRTHYRSTQPTRTYAVERGGVVIRCFITNAGQDAPPTVGVASEHALRRPMNRATTI